MSGLHLAILGGGRLATRVAELMTRTPAQVRVWARNPRARETLRHAHPKAHVHDDMGAAVADADMVLFAVPAEALPEVADHYGPHARGDHVVLHACRGVGPGFTLPHAAIRAVTCVRKVGALGGPLYFDEASSQRPLVAVLASRYDEVAEMLKTLVKGTPIKVHTTMDVVGVEVAGAISNVAALASGMADALEMGETSRGVLLTRGLSEATRLGVRLGGEVSTFSGLAGVGDLIPRHVSSTRRHRDVGGLMAQGASLEGALQSVEGCVEGVATAREAAALAGRLKLNLPLMRVVNDILEGRAKARPALEEILKLDLELDKEAVGSRA
ncbi:MAG: NAD(P)-binding domain-containing protein [Deltaproteobacteria bacterium]|nr:NAD(P)-binding domain-containing protein [Deltaproteobacteria bacterium]